MAQRQKFQRVSLKPQEVVVNSLTKEPAGIGQRDPASGASEQLQAKLIFKLLKLLADRAVGEGKIIRSLTEALSTGHGAEDLQRSS